MNSKIPLDLGFCEVFTDARSGERTPTGAVRRGLRPSPHRSRGESGIGARTVFTATSDRAVGLPREDESNDESANAAGDRGGRRVRPGRRRLRVAAETETCWSVRRARGNLQSEGATARRPGTLGAFGRRVTCRPRAAGARHLRVKCGNGVVVRSRRIWGHPNWTRRGRFRLAPGPRARATGSA